MAIAASLLILMLIAPAIHAAEHTVGGNQGWDETVDYNTWVNGKTFTVGDTLVFNYATNHKVDIVNQNAYKNCVTSNPIQSYSGGKTTITLNTTGSMYFLCPTSNHCTQGQRLAITVAASSGGATPPTAASPPPPSSSGSPGSPPPPSSSNASPPPPSGNGANGRLYNLMLGLLLVLGTGFALNY